MLDAGGLDGISTFQQLVKYLRDELDWPIQPAEFADLTFDYTPDEVGLKLDGWKGEIEIKQLRPLAPSQPWGIFFIEFPRERLPVTVLRRILGKLAVSKRGTAKGAERAAWQKEDLLFIASHGETGQRQLTFAHFHEDRGHGDLPTLRVLGWDGRNTLRRLSHTHGTLQEKLRWPEVEANLAAWRERWGSAFTEKPRQSITTSIALAKELAALASQIRARANQLLEAENEQGPLRRLLKAFQEALIHDINEDGFADMYAQTIAYGLLSARISRSSGVLVADNVADMAPPTNPFLKELLETFLKAGGRKGGMDFDELGVTDVVEMLRQADMEAVLRDFDDRNPQEDPVIHFYELFLKEYDAKKRLQRGVFYTPRPVVSYIVRSVHELLQTEFGLADGLADTTTWGEMARKNPAIKLPDSVKPDDPFVQILDPATGTATFLVEVIDVIHNTMQAKWIKRRLTDTQQRAAWNDYVPEHLLPRLYGYELMMAPYAISHMKIGLKLYETGYRFDSQERARIYLTNALEPSQDFSDRFAFNVPALAHEAQAVNAIKRSCRFTIIIGNPPYSNYGQLNKNPYIIGLLEDYKRDLAEKKLNLDDEFIKFTRLAQHLIDSAGVGYIGMITNNVFLDGLVHRKMRNHLSKTFNDIRFLNAHGDTRKQEEVPAGLDDKNIFDIQQGVAITILSRSPHIDNSTVRYADLWGSRRDKYNTLSHANVLGMQWEDLRPEPPYFFFVPKNFSTRTEYEQWPSVKDIFVAIGKGIKTERDRVSIHFTPEGIKQAVKEFRSEDVKFIRKKYELEEDSRDWKVASAKADVAENVVDCCYRQILYRPFDIRYTWYSGRTRGFIGTPGYPIMRHMLKDNIAVILTRHITGLPYNHVFATRRLTEIKCVSHDRSCDVVPMMVYDDAALTLEAVPNLRPAFIRALSESLGCPIREGEVLPADLKMNDVCGYAYAVFYSPTYRSRYAELLKIDFPRLPLTKNRSLFDELARLGGELISVHLLESSKLKKLTGEFIGGKCPVVEKVSWSGDTVWLDKGKTTGFTGISAEVWRFLIGGYQVCDKWLKDRRGRTLTNEEIAHYQKIVVALSETIRIMNAIDEVIDAHGGWPSAFAVSGE
ncbi:MAG: type ISP restriction/modification enzyme [Rhodomicrobium sp.]